MDLKTLGTPTRTFQAIFTYHSLELFEYDWIDDVVADLLAIVIHGNLCSITVLQYAVYQCYDMQYNSVTVCGIIVLHYAV